MPSAIAKKTTKPTSASFQRTKSAVKRKVVTVRACKGVLGPGHFDAIVKKYGGRPLTPEERQEFRRFAKDPYP